MENTELIACRECDALHQHVRLGKNTSARCVRCGAVLYRYFSGNVDYLLMIALTSVVLFLLANSLPIVELKAKGLTNQATLIGGISHLWASQGPLIAILVTAAVMLAPLLECVAFIYLLVPLRLGRIAPGFHQILRIIQLVQPWGMLEVFMLGVIVTLIKLSSFARIIPGPALFAFSALTFLLTALSAFDPHHLWRLVQRQQTAKAGEKVTQ